jgi:putative tryptophan/tyrosine transport system substrate-binding protein
VPLLQETRTLPIVFVQAVDPVGSGLVANLSRPGGNVTGFASFDYGLSGKWLELLKEIAPRMTRIAVIRSPVQFAGFGQLGAIQAIASSLGVELTPVDCVRRCVPGRRGPHANRITVYESFEVVDIP